MTPVWFPPGGGSGGGGSGGGGGGGSPFRVDTFAASPGAAYVSPDTEYFAGGMTWDASGVMLPNGVMGAILLPVAKADGSVVCKVLAGGVGSVGPVVRWANYKNWRWHRYQKGGGSAGMVDVLANTEDTLDVKNNAAGAELMTAGQHWWIYGRTVGAFHRVEVWDADPLDPANTVAAHRKRAVQSGDDDANTKPGYFGFGFRDLTGTWKLESLTVA